MSCGETALEKPIGKKEQKVHSSARIKAYPQRADRKPAYTNGRSGHFGVSLRKSPPIQGEIDGTLARFANDYQAGVRLWGVGGNCGNRELPGADTDVAAECQRSITFQ